MNVDVTLISAIKSSALVSCSLEISKLEAVNVKEILYKYGSWWYIVEACPERVLSAHFAGDQNATHSAEAQLKKHH